MPDLKHHLKAIVVRFDSFTTIAFAMSLNLKTYTVLICFSFAKYPVSKAAQHIVSPRGDIYRGQNKAAMFVQMPLCLCIFSLAVYALELRSICGPKRTNLV